MQDESTQDAFEEQMDARMKELLEDSFAKVEGPLYHYTRADGLMGILGERVVHATHYRYLNDSSEISLGEDNVKSVVRDLLGDPASARHRPALERFAETYEKQKLSSVIDMFVVSFTEEGNLLSQWRAYGANGGGYSLGLSKVHFDGTRLEALGAAAALYKCDYDVTTFRSQVRRILLGLLDAVEQHAHLLGDASRKQRQAMIYLLQAMVTFVPALKDESFREEREWRLVVFPLLHTDLNPVEYRACPRRGLVPFIKVPLMADLQRLPVVEVVVGPTHERDAACAALRGYLAKLGYEDVDSLVKASGIPYRG